MKTVAQKLQFSSPPQHPAIETTTTTPPTAWTIELSLPSGEVVQRITQCDASSTMAMFADLDPGREYRVRVAGENTRGTGFFSEYASTMTHPGKTRRNSLQTLTSA